MQYLPEILCQFVLSCFFKGITTPRVLLTLKLCSQRHHPFSICVSIFCLLYRNLLRRTTLQTKPHIEKLCSDYDKSVTRLPILGTFKFTDAFLFCVTLALFKSPIAPYCLHLFLATLTLRSLHLGLVYF